ncbi:hypothetical protein EGI22_12620 [Lacihabitans sp. LS3-19]|nr:hypothetical protein [Lacihabitans sp. LS3-19]
MNQIYINKKEFYELRNFVSDNLFQVEDSNSSIMISFSHKQKEEILEILGNKILKIGITNGIINSKGLKIEHLIDIFQ